MSACGLMIALKNTTMEGCVLVSKVVFEGTTTRGRKWSLISEPRPRGKAPGKAAKQIKWKTALLRQEVTDGCYIDKNKAPPRRRPSRRR